MKSFGDIYADFVGTSKAELYAKCEGKLGKFSDSEKNIATVLVMAVMKADGVVSGGEEAVIEKTIKASGIDMPIEEAKNQILNLSEDVVNKAKFDFRSLPDQVKEDIIFCLLYASSSDGLIAKDEYNLIKSYLA